MKQVTLLRTVMMCVLFVGLLMATPKDSYATHFRYGNITWEEVPGQPNQIRFRVTQAWRTSFPGFPATVNVGSVVNGGVLNTGAGTTPINLTVTSINAAEDWFYGEFIYVKTYPSAGTYIASFNSCCRISTLQNNADDPFVVSTIVQVGNGNNAPVSTIPPFIYMPKGASAASYQLPATDPDGDPLTYSLVPNGQFGTTTVQPDALSVSSSGLLTFNTDTLGRDTGQLYNVAVYVTDTPGARIQLDFLIRITTPSTPPLFDYGVTPANNINYVIQPGQTLNFDVKAYDNDSFDIVNLSAVGLPSGSSFSPGSGNPVTRSFSWTPNLSSFGTHQINFIAQDIANIQTSTIVNINVSLKPNFVTPSPGNNSTLCYLPGATINETFKATDVDSTDSVSLSLVTTAQAGMSFSPSLPTGASNPVSTNMTWNTSSANWGINTVVMRATDKYNDSRDDTVYYIINTPPVFTTTPASTSVIAGQLYSYTFGTADADSAQGDSVDVETATYPSWLTLTDNNDGTWTLSGTPSIADSGNHNILIEIEDLTNHFNATHCGHATQTFVLTVIPCNITTTTAVTDVLCNGDATGAIDLTVNNATAPVSYTWSNSASTEDLSGVPAGTYSVAIVDANGCTAADTATIAEPATALNATISASTMTIYIGYGAQSATLSATASGGTPGYSYSWSTGDTTASITVSPTMTTTYTLVVTDANGCVFTAAKTITVEDIRCGNNNDKVIICHIPPGNPSKQKTLCIDSPSVAAHLAHGCTLGPCGAAKKRTDNEQGSSFTIEEVVTAELSIYPNPNSGLFTIELPVAEAANIIVTNINGQVVYTSSTNDDQRKVSIDLSQVSKGLYMITVTQGHQNYHSKITIQ